MMDGAWRSILKRYGQTVTVYLPGQQEGVETQAFLQPVLRQGEDQQVPSPLGLRREDRFLYLGPVQVPLQDGAQVEWQKNRYTVESAHLVGPQTGGHIWAMLRPRDKEEGQ